MRAFKLDVLRRVAETRSAASRAIELRIRVSPVQILGDERVTGIQIRRNELFPNDGKLQPRPLDLTETLQCGLVFRSVGYRGRPLAGVPFDDRAGVIPNDGGRVVDQTLGSTPVRGVYTAGWAKRGPRAGSEQTTPARPKR